MSKLNATSQLWLLCIATYATFLDGMIRVFNQTTGRPNYYIGITVFIVGIVPVECMMGWIVRMRRADFFIALVQRSIQAGSRSRYTIDESRQPIPSLPPWNYRNIRFIDSIQHSFSIVPSSQSIDQLQFSRFTVYIIFLRWQSVMQMNSLLRESTIIMNIHSKHEMSTVGNRCHMTRVLSRTRNIPTSCGKNELMRGTLSRP